MQFLNEHELRAFLRLCIDPGSGRDKRTPARMADAVHPACEDALRELAPPYLEAYRRNADDLAKRAEGMRQAYAVALLAWTRDEQPSDRLLALADEATAHSHACPWCTVSGVLSAQCKDGTRFAKALLTPFEDTPAGDAPEDRAQHCNGAALTHNETGICNHPVDQAEEPPCPHESWDVTSEYPAPNGGGWVKSRKCNDCREPLEQICEPTPHFEDNGAHAPAASASGHATVEETIATSQPDTSRTEKRSQRPAALPWTNVLQGDEPFELLGELNLVLQDGHAQHEGETHDDRARRILGGIDRVLGSWQDAIEHRRPTSYLTRDGRVWTYRGEHRAKGGPALYESPTSPKAYTFAELRNVYGWVAAVQGLAPVDGETVTTTFEHYAAVCRENGLIPFTTALVRSGASPAMHAAVHVSIDPDLELDTNAVDQVITAVCDGLTCPPWRNRRQPF
ncbi:hypothetical protein FE633_10785 [Streptomyces montanus]|uniref:Uncharacterized protein n=1 Tax=Streptomyces montanus TaxID=2580423 RepID=A0A5R9FZ66_9ACTN|nr:hypothetical protein [Streptomyces montanus]TLS46033.1 hypothetical protein FE633_10785 [Streptomyces montanus]